MPTASYLSFDSYRLDLVNECLWHGTQLVPLRAKPFAVLRYLVEHAGRLVTKGELLQAVWPETRVNAEVLKAYIHDLRTVLGKEAEAPLFIETVARRGYRFMGAVTATAADTPPEERREAPANTTGPSRVPSPQATEPPMMVGREAELQQLQGWFAQALRSRRQVVFVTGEAGIGKTTLVETFVAQAVIPRGCWLGQGQCIEHFGAGEAYLPVLAALGQLCRTAGHERFRALLGQYAPTWLAQMSTVLSTAEQEALQRRTLGATRERMLRELAEALELLTAEQPLVLVLEDLHWSDYATLDFLAFVARRREPARLLVIGTYRPAEVILRDHPLKRVKQELQLHGQCQELALELLPEGAVAAYLAARFPGHQAQAALVRTFYQRTDGNPLFLVTIVEELLRQGLLVAVEKELVLNAASAGTLRVPETLHQMLEQQVERLSPAEQQMLEAASVAGAEFSPAAVAAGLAAPVEDVEQRCAALARHGQFVRATGTVEWPDGTVATRYEFLHALYQEVLYERVTAAQRMSLHCRIGEREEHAYGARASEIAAELAVHFEQGREYRKAVQYLQQAGENAVSRSAHQEAITLLTKGVELLKTLPDTPERAQQELMLQISLGVSLIAAKGYGAPEVEHAYSRALELCHYLSEPAQRFPALGGLWQFYICRTEYQKAYELAEEFLTLAQHAQDPALLLGAHDILGQTYYTLGEFVRAQEHFEQGRALSRLQPRRSLASLVGGEDPELACRGYAEFILYHLGFPDQALHWSHEAFSLAQELRSPFNLGWALMIAVQFHQFRREAPVVQEQAEALIALSTEYGFAGFLALGTILRGWALAAQGQAEEGGAQICQGLAAYRATGAKQIQPYFLALLAEAYGQVGHAVEGLSALTEALAIVEDTGERFYEVDLYRLKGELTLQQFHVSGSTFQVDNPQSAIRNPQLEAEACFLKAIEVARHQQARSWELRATVSLGRLWQQQGKRAEAHELLSEIYGWFTEGFDTKDLQEAQALLQALS